MRAFGSLLLFAVLVPACQDGPYSAPPGDFFCGSTYCEISTQFCVLAPGADGGAQTAACGAATGACPDGMPTCACVASQCQGTCSQGADGSVTLTCAH
jgi:hypothetical protein